MTNNEYVNIVLHSIKHEIIGFLQNDMLLTIQNISDMEGSLPETNRASIELNSHIKFTASISIDEELFNFLFKKFFTQKVEDSEKEELYELFPDEIINIVVGLAIRYFPSELGDFDLSIPFKLTGEKYQEMLKNNISKSLKISTNHGAFVYTVSYH